MNDAGERYHLLIEHARVAVGRGDRVAAEKLLTEAVAIGERQLGAEHPALAVALNELSRLHIWQSDFARAEPILLRLVKLSRAKGDRHPDVATALAGLAVAKRGLGDDLGAELLFRRALRMREEALAPNHMAIVITLEQLSEACAARGKFAEALVHLQRALLRRERTLGAEHTTVRGLRARIAGLERRHAEWTARAAERATAPSMPTIATTSAPAATAMLVEPSAHDGMLSRQIVEESPAPASSAWHLSQRSRRATRYASGAAVVAVLVIAGFAFRSPVFRGSDRDAAPSDSGDQLALVTSEPGVPESGGASAARRHDSLSVAMASGAYDAPMGAATLSLASNPAAGASSAPVAPPPLRSLVVPKVAMPSLDSVLRTSSADERDVGAEPIGAASSRTGEEASVVPPVLIGSAPTARYPDELRSQRIEGDVVVQFRVNEKGRVEPSSMQVILSRHPLFAEAVRSVLPRFRFEPAHSGAAGSKPQAAWVQFHTRFAAQQ
jgi:TonB family protein